MRRLLTTWLPVVLWMGFIFAMSTRLGGSDNTSRIIEPMLRWLFPRLSPDGIEELHHWIRKAAHFTEYAVLGLLVFRALAGSFPSADRPGFRLAGLALLISAAYAATDEFHQCFVAGRTPALGDVLIDASGAFVALVAAAWRRWRSRPVDLTTNPH
ncbi:MAG: putative rane protein [Lacunisphaera sp.]|nr:putative rane protein [Lacunisphaera sp.]